MKSFLGAQKCVADAGTAARGFLVWGDVFDVLVAVRLEDVQGQVQG